ncbi:MAG: response regulator [Burkholderiaceae bacterium]|nr:response regulator [Burkholderiaceae bacterium]
MTRSARAARVIWVVVVVFVLAVGLVAAWLLRTFDHEAVGNARSQVESLARSAESALNRVFLDVDFKLAGLDNLPGLFDAGDVVAHSAPKLLQSVVEQGLLVRDLALVDAHGEVIAAAAAPTSHLGIDLPAGFLDALAGQAVPQMMVSTPSTSRAGGDKIILFARRSQHTGRGPVFAIAAVPVAALTGILGPPVDIDGLTLTLEHEDGVLLASVPAHDSLLGRRQAVRPGPRVAPSGVTLTAGRLGEPLVYAAARPTLYGSVWVTAELSAGSVDARSRAARTTTVAMAGFLALLAVVLGALTQTTLRRLTRVSRDALQARQVLEQALASMDEGFLLWDADQRVLSWNERYLELFPHLRGTIAAGTGLQVVAEAGARGMLPQASEAERRAWIEQRLADRYVTDRENEQHLPDGRIVSVVERRTASGGTVSVYRDVTRARAAAEELERARLAAEAANEAKTRFLATMSHELRTPLNGVLGMNGLLLDTALDPRQRMYAETIRSSGEALLDIINDVLDMSRLEAGRMVLESVVFDPVALVGEVAALLSARATDKGITLTMADPPGMPARLVGDAGRIRQVLFNLIGNAVKFTQAGSVVVQSEHAARGDGRVDWTLRVRDTGIGIAPEVLPTLFERFTQADNSFSRRYGGSGLGLAISRELVELMGGEIGVASRLGEGSEFRVRLPLAVAPGTPATAEAAQAAAGTPGPALPSAPAGLRVLVVDDNRVSQLLLSAMLAQRGHFVDVVADGSEALRQVQQARYDLVLMDIQMPLMDGVSATCAIRALAGPAGRVPIVAVSAHVLPDQRAQYLAAGMNELLTKPIDASRLDAVLAGAVPPP